MTRHGMVQTSTKSTQLLATDPRASMTIIDVDRAAVFDAPSRQYQANGRRGHPSASIPALPDDVRAIPRNSRKTKSP